jgi:hypothetical protein
LVRCSDHAILIEMKKLRLLSLCTRSSDLLADRR